MATPSGYLKRKVADSVEEALQLASLDNIKTTTKATVQRYIQSFMDRSGGNRDLYKVLSKQGLNFITDYSFEPDSDATLRKVQLARMFENLRQQLPCILIVDHGFEIIPTNINGLDAVRREGRDWIATMAVHRRIPLTIAVGTRDESTVDFFQGILSILFEEMRFLAGGSFIPGNRLLGETHVVTIARPVPGSIVENKIPDSPKDIIWSTSIDLNEVTFEDRVDFKQRLPRLELGQEIMNPPGALGNTAPIIICPSTIPFNSPTNVRFQYLQPPPHHKIIITDPNICTFEPHGRFLMPRRLGKFYLQVVKPKTTVDGTGTQSEVVASQLIQVVS